MSKHISEILNLTSRRLENRARGLEKPIPVPWPHLAEAIGGGWWPGAYAMVGGTGVGKTQFAIQIALEAAIRGVPVKYIGLEMNMMDIVARTLGLYSGTDWSNYFLGQVKPEQLISDLEKFGPELNALPLSITTARPQAWTPRDLLKEAEAFRAGNPQKEPGEKPLLMVLDFIQLMGSERPREELRQTVKRTAYITRALAEQDITSLMVSSTSRSNYELLEGWDKGDEDEDAPYKKDPRRLVGAGKESGDLEYACDGLMVLTRQPMSQTMWCAIAKFRAGPPCWLPFTFTGSKMVVGTAPKSPTKLKDKVKHRMVRDLMFGKEYRMSMAAFVQQTRLGDGDAKQVLAELQKEGIATVEENHVTLKVEEKKDAEGSEKIDSKVSTGKGEAKESED